MKLVSLGSIARVSSGGTPSRQESAYWGGSIPWIKTGDISQRYIRSCGETITDRAANETAAKIYPSGTLLMALYGQGKTRGSVAILHIDAAINQACAAIQLCAGYEKLYVFYQLEHRYEHIRSLSHTGNQENLNADIVRSILIPVIPLPEQKKIAKILGACDQAIEAQERLVALKQERKKGLAQKLLTGKVRLPAFRNEPVWRLLPLSSLATRINTSAGTRKLPILSITAGVGYVSQLDKFSKVIAGRNYQNYSVIQAGDFAYNKGNSAIYPQGCIYPLTEYPEGAVPNVYYCFRFNEGVVCGYYAQLFQAAYHNRQLRSLINSGVRNDGLLNLNVHEFFSLRLPVPSTSEQRSIATVLDSLDKDIRLEQQKLNLLQQQKKGLMQQLLSGKVRVAV